MFDPEKLLFPMFIVSEMISLFDPEKLLFPMCVVSEMISLL
jgi:hypothetical protein